ncbi:unnamed protein product [Microthlaspi erraticum]|uniref:DUF4283 domain-containing protein n=1 Tax=Microthlaspi erraticum TaxID=1685480 RepID=A0A6D2KNK8_9BRAS|nr:unnamed protein product [Microthlaspi erraticum]
MRRQLTWEEKGKGKMVEQKPPRIRVKAPNLDTTTLVKKHELTLIGRVTNPDEQQMRTMFPYLIRKWKLKGSAAGSDLGRGCFQVRFELEEDLEKILAKRPHHYGHWMLILQRWEPIISPTFPAYIPFWIELKGIPLHYWQRDLLYSIGEELGGMMKHEITSTTARIKVLINGLQPLVKETIIEYSDEAESIVSLEYEGLENHCRICYRLTHDTYRCQETKGDEQNPRLKEPSEREERPQKNFQGQPKGGDFNKRADRYGKPYGDRISQRERNTKEEEHRRNQSNRRIETQGYRRERTPPRSNHRTGKSRDMRQTLQNREEERRSYQHPQQIWREKERDTRRTPPRREESVTSRPSQIPLGRTLDFTGSPTNRIPTLEEAMADLQEVTVQYVDCGDPIESEARRQRVLLGEMEGLMATTAANMVTAATAAAASETQTYQENEQQTQRYAEIQNAQEPQEEENIHVPSTRKRGRPPLARKTLGKSPMRLTGATSPSRKMNLTQRSPWGRKMQASQATNAGASTSRTVTPRQKAIMSNRTGNATRPPRVPSPRAPSPSPLTRRVDFQNPPNPLP